MTLKEIYKIIDEADFFLLKENNKKYIIGLDDQYDRLHEKNCIEENIESDCVYIFFKLNDNYEVEKRWVVDHIDPETKIIKKRLHDMSDEEIENFKNKECKKHSECFNCPLYNGETDPNYSPCYFSFIYARKLYLNSKNKEFEVEVEE